MKTIRKLAFLFSITIAVFLISACNIFSTSDDDDEITVQPQAKPSQVASSPASDTNNPTDPIQTPPPQPTSPTGRESSPFSGYVTYHDAHLSVHFPIPEMESGWYQCAVSEYKYNTFPAGSAIQITANGNTINMIVTDLCPQSQVPNGNGITSENYYFDLEESTFSVLAHKSIGILSMTCKTVPYPTEKNISFMTSELSSYYLKGLFYNMRYPLKKVECSIDGGATFNQMAIIERTNSYSLEPRSRIPEAIIIRLTDIYDQTVTTAAIQLPSANEKVNLGINFPY